MHLKYTFLENKLLQTFCLWIALHAAQFLLIFLAVFFGNILKSLNILDEMDLGMNEFSSPHLSGYYCKWCH